MREERRREAEALVRDLEDLVGRLARGQDALVRPETIATAVNIGLAMRSDGELVLDALLADGTLYLPGGADGDDDHVEVFWTRELRATMALGLLVLALVLMAWALDPDDPIRVAAEEIKNVIWMLIGIQWERTRPE